MRAALTMLIAIGLVGLGMFLLFRGQYFSGGVFLLGSAAIILPALSGRGMGSVGDADQLMDFVRNPVGTLIESAIDQVGGGSDDEDQPKRNRFSADAVAAPAFDPDAALARYMERRDPNAEPLAPPTAPIRTFGRKQA